MQEHKNKELYSARAIFYILCLLILTSCAGGKKAKIRQRKIDAVISTARSYIGTPYKWGGTKRTGMDCSGLLFVSFQSAGITIPRVSSDQSKEGKKVKFDKLEEGDLVFFAMGKRRRKITHVGLVTEVRGPDNVRFIHASSSLGVIEANIHTNYYTKKFRKARRYF